MFVKTPEQNVVIKEATRDWGSFVALIDYSTDNYANRAIHIYANGYLTRYDRSHWQDQFGALPDFRMGKHWLDKWGEPEELSLDEFQILWKKAEDSPPYEQRDPSPTTACLWVEKFKMGDWISKA